MKSRRGPQIGQWLRILRRKRLSKWFECFQHHHPGRDARAKIFRQKRTERLIFPSLHIPRTPVIHQDQAENVICGAIDRHRFAQCVSRSDQEGRLQFVIEAAARTKNRCRGVGRLDLSMGTPHFRPAHDNGAGATVIGDRKPFPVWHERVFRTAQHRADIVGVVIG